MRGVVALVAAHVLDGLRDRALGGRKALPRNHVIATHVRHGDGHPRRVT